MKTISFSSRLEELDKEAGLVPAKGCSDPLNNPAFLDRLQHRSSLYAGLGSSLAKTFEIGRNGLKLYCGVPVKFLCPEDALLQDEYLDFVVCRGQNVVMALKLMGMDEQLFHETTDKFQASSFPPGLVQFFQSNFFDDMEWIAGDVIAPSVGNCFQTSGPHMKSSLILIPSDLLKQLSAPSMKILERFMARRRKCWVPTEYGRSLGIFQGFRIDANNTVRPLLCCARESLDALRKAASWGEQDVSFQANERCSFSQRIDGANQGMTRNIAPVMDMILRLGEMPLSDYFKDDPDGLIEMINAFPQARTYQQAAAHIDKIHRSNPKTAQRYLSVFIHPLVRKGNVPIADHSLHSYFYAASLLAQSEYLTWRGEMIFQMYDPKGIAKKVSLQTWIQWVNKKIKQGEETSNYFYELAFHLTVEPFCLIQTAESKKISETR